MTSRASRESPPWSRCAASMEYIYRVQKKITIRFDASIFIEFISYTPAFAQIYRVQTRICTEHVSCELLSHAQHIATMTILAGL